LADAFFAAALAGAFFAAVLAGAFFAAVLAGAFFADAFFAAVLAGADLAAVLLADFLADFLAGWGAALVALVAFESAEPRETTLRAAAPARLTKDLLVADAMTVGTPIG
jgi:hypothetical protein